MQSRIALQDLSVMVIEPSQTQFHVIQDYLKDFGVTNVVHYQDAGSALTAMKANSPDLVISAMHLPDMTGCDLIHEMRNSPSLNEIVFMLVSSETDYRYLEPVRQAGAVAILPKPFEPEHLAKALSATLDFIDPASIDISSRDIEDLKVLIVDDSPFARHYIRRTLEKMGIEFFVEAENGREAINCIKEHYFDLLVTDYNMPEMDGRELIQFIRGSTDQAAMPILMVTSESDVSQLAAIEQAGVSAMCDKPFDARSVRELIQRIVV